MGRARCRWPAWSVAIVTITLATLMIMDNAEARLTWSQQQPPADDAKPKDDDQGAPEGGGSWPRTYQKAGSDQRVIVYQPQVDSWEKYRNVSFRCALSVSGAAADTVYGVAEVHADTEVDADARTVLLKQPQIDFRFPDADPVTATAAEQLAREVLPKGEAMQVSLDRVLAYMDSSKTRQKEVQVSLDPPPIFYSRRLAILLLFTGEPEFKPVPFCDLSFAVNANWDVLRDATGRTYLLYGDSWLQTDDVLKGPWQPARNLPDAFARLPSDDEWKAVRSKVPGEQLDAIPAVFTSTKPAELIVTDGDPAFKPIPGIRVQAVNNTESPLFKHTGDGQFYYLAAGRWFRAKSLNGPWKAATKDLPPDFKHIPPDGDWADVLASVPGTDAADDAVMLASVPRRATVDIKALSIDVTYDGQPQFVPVEGTSVQFATNTSWQVFLCQGKYLCCDNAVWFTSPSPTGPWSVATSVPDEIYSIPANHPAHNVTYTHIYDAYAETVSVGYTSGYNDALVTAGVLVLGAGVLAAVANSDAVIHFNVHGGAASGWQSYGRGAFYNPFDGGFCRAGISYGPYAGVGGAAAFNANNGTWGRRGSTYGASAGAQSAGGRGDAYGARIGGSDRFGEWKRGVTARSDDWGGGRGVGERNGAGWAQTSDGNGRAGRGPGGRGGADGDLFVGRDGNVYRRDSDGRWQERSGGNWRSADGPGAGGGGLDAEARARRRGDAAANLAGSSRNPSVAGRGRGGGGGGGRRGR